MSANLFEKCEPISAVLAPYVQQMIISELEDSCDNLEYLCIGSVGKKKDEDFNGDIDIAIKCKDIEELKRIIYHTFEHLNIVISETLYIVSIEYPYIYDNEEKYVQCDFMVMWYTDYTAFRYFCPNYRNDESKYKLYSRTGNDNIEGLLRDFDYEYDNIITKVKKQSVNKNDYLSADYANNESLSVNEDSSSYEKFFNVVISSSPRSDGSTLLAIFETPLG